MTKVTVILIIIFTSFIVVHQHFLTLVSQMGNVEKVINPPLTVKRPGLSEC